MQSQFVQIIQGGFCRKVVLRAVGKCAHAGRTYNGKTVENREVIRIFTLLF